MSEHLTPAGDRMAGAQGITKSSGHGGVVSLNDVYLKLYERFGPQKWWPQDGRFEVIIGAILTQSTAWTNVEKAIASLKHANVLCPRGLRSIPHARLAALIYSSGYFNAKARKIKAFVEHLGSYYSGDLDAMFRRETRELRRELLSLHGIGEETADSILLYAADRPVFVIDAYTRRIVERLGLRPEGDSYSAYQELFMACLPCDPALFNEYHALLVALGKEVCRKKPICDRCCLNTLCAYGREQVGEIRKERMLNNSFNPHPPSASSGQACQEGGVN